MSSENCTNHTIMTRKYKMFHFFYEAGDYLVSNDIIESFIETCNNCGMTSNDGDFTQDLFCFKIHFPSAYR